VDGIPEARRRHSRASCYPYDRSPDDNLAHDGQMCQWIPPANVMRQWRVEIGSKVDRGWRLKWSERLAPTPAGPGRSRHLARTTRTNS